MQNLIAAGQIALTGHMSLSFAKYQHKQHMHTPALGLPSIASLTASLHVCDHFISLSLYQLIQVSGRVEVCASSAVDHLMIMP